MEMFFLSFIPLFFRCCCSHHIYTCRCFFILYIYGAIETHYSFCLNHFRAIYVGMSIIGFMDPSPWCSYINCGKLHVYVRSTIPIHLPQRYGWLDFANKMGPKTRRWNVWMSGRKGVFEYLLYKRLPRLWIYH